jgi:Caspase domain
MKARLLISGAGTGASNNLIRSLITGDASLYIVGCHAGHRPRLLGRGHARGEGVALVIGNGTYDGSPLRNPVSEACAMARALRELRFEITAIENATQRKMRLSIIRFGDGLRGGGVGRFFFAGHRVQVGGKNFMIPVGAAIPAWERVVGARQPPRPRGQGLREGHRGSLP